MSFTKNRMCVTADPLDEENGLGGAAGQTEGPCSHSAVQWTPGEEPPPFTIDNPAAVQLCVQIISGAPVDLPAILVSEAVAVQVYRLVHDK